MTRQECLDKAKRCVLQDRQNQCGDPVEGFRRAARLWNAYLGPWANASLEPCDVAVMMALLKAARIKGNPGHEDSFVGMAWCVALGAELAPGDSCLKPRWRTPAKADARGAGGPEFRKGDKVLASFGPGSWLECEYLRDEGRGPHAVRCPDGTVETAPVVRHVPWADGAEDAAGRCRDCEGFADQEAVPAECGGCFRTLARDEPVQKDAPQTSEDVCRHILDSNPEVYGRPHVPTGEELAEALEEERHG